MATQRSSTGGTLARECARPTPAAHPGLNSTLAASARPGPGQTACYARCLGGEVVHVAHRAHRAASTDRNRLCRKMWAGKQAPAGQRGVARCAAGRQAGRQADPATRGATTTTHRDVVGRGRLQACQGAGLVGGVGVGRHGAAGERQALSTRLGACRQHVAVPAIRRCAAGCRHHHIRSGVCHAGLVDRNGWAPAQAGGGEGRQEVLVSAASEVGLAGRAGPQARRGAAMVQRHAAATEHTAAAESSRHGRSEVEGVTGQAAGACAVDGASLRRGRQAVAPRVSEGVPATAGWLAATCQEQSAQQLLTVIW